MSDVNPAPNLDPEMGHRYTNRLIRATSPYLLQHAHNPVDWYPWGDEALERARAEDRPILLSVGYAACHWCHVMERESFENERIAAIMNLHYVCIKVDREERPDIDAIYMDAVQAMTQRGGWPMTVFLLPNGLPFFAGTYFPPEDRYGMPGFSTILLRLANMYRTRRREVEEQAEEFRLFFAGRGKISASLIPVSAAEVDFNILTAAERQLTRSFDETNGGFGGAPKFPHTMSLEFLLRLHLRESARPVRMDHVVTATNKPTLTPLAMVTRTLDRMADGGIYDHLGGGFHRYSVDDHWQVPHFEKMLYDNALLARCYLHAYQVTGNERYARVCRETLDFIRRDMTSPEGGFYATLDADSEGEEGKFYVWKPEEIRAVLDKDASLFMAAYDVTEDGNFENTRTTVLHRARPIAAIASEMGISPDDAERYLAEARLALYAARSRRIWPNIDDKIITAWNGLMLRAFAEASEVFSSETYAEVAVTNAAFLLEKLRDENGRLQRTYRKGIAHQPAFLDDYAALALGLLATYEATFDPQWFTAGRQIVDEMILRFADDEDCGFYDTADDHEQLVTRPREIMDNATPSGNSLAAEALLWLAAITGDQGYRDRAERYILRLAPTIAQQPSYFGHLLSILDRWLSPSQEVAIIGDLEHPDTLDLLAIVRARYRPNTVVAVASPVDAVAIEAVPLLAGRTQLAGAPTAFVCSGFACRLPVNEPLELATQLGDV
jgi:uncharacterized protein